MILTTLPSGFGYLHLLIPEIRQNILYNTADNFTARPIDGYTKPYTVLLLITIKALQQAQILANEFGYDLLIYDGYRSVRSCTDIIQWCSNEHTENAQFYYPYLTKAELLQEDYMQSIFDYCTGLTVSLTLIRKDKPLQNTTFSMRTYQGHTLYYRCDGSIDMYSGVDCFDDISQHNSPNIPSAFLEKRNLLKYIMEKSNFLCHPKQWWRYTLHTEQKYNKLDFLFLIPFASLFS